MSLQTRGSPSSLSPAFLIRRLSEPPPRHGPRRGQGQQSTSGPAGSGWSPRPGELLQHRLPPAQEHQRSSAAAAARENDNTSSERKEKERNMVSFSSACPYHRCARAGHGTLLGILWHSAYRVKPTLQNLRRHLFSVSPNSGNKPRSVQNIASRSLISALSPPCY